MIMLEAHSSNYHILNCTFYIYILLFLLASHFILIQQWKNCSIFILQNVTLFVRLMTHHSVFLSKVLWLCTSIWLTLHSDVTVRLIYLEQLYICIKLWHLHCHWTAIKQNSGERPDYLKVTTQHSVEQRCINNKCSLTGFRQPTK